ncbi:PQQ-binding-like beta-propeller repeat protein [Haloarcula rara]|uniref:outer membrane protein assembly factor BamB family protein n=2 Tax=Haloarcula TaxID=2237 RepID=UPI0023E80DC3|nr:PQQ-binding-like beta-propeller repeat protein [Halomicroarcula sp. SHR3]
MTERRRQSRRGLLAAVAVTATAGCLRSNVGQSSEARSAGTATRTGDTDTDDRTGDTDGVTSGWPAFGADRTGRGTADVTPPGTPLAAEWSVALDAEAGDPAVSDGTVYVVGRTSITALDAATGSEEWVYDVGLANGGPAPTVVGDTVYATPGDGYAYALSTEGEFQWSEQLTAGNGTSRIGPRPVADTVVVADQRQIAGLAADTGEREWARTVPGNGITGIVTDGKRVYVGSFTSTIDEPTVLALDGASGETVWRQDGQFNGAHAPAVVDGTVYAGGFRKGTPLFALDAETGDTMWTQTVSAEIHTSPAVGESTVYVSDLRGTLHAVERETGTRRWQTDLREETVETDPVNSSAPALVDGQVYLGTQSGQMVVIDTEDGSVLSSVTVGETVLASPAVADGRVIVGSTDGTLSAYVTN